MSFFGASWAEDAASERESRAGLIDDLEKMVKTVDVKVESVYGRYWVVQCQCIGSGRILFDVKGKTLHEAIRTAYIKLRDRDYGK